jgi:ketosteroid isomerase-like protein
MTRNSDTVQRYLDGFTTSDHAQILSCLTDDIEWTLFGGYHLSGKDAYDAEIENPGFQGSPDLRVVRLVEQDDVVMGELMAKSTASTDR